MNHILIVERDKVSANSLQNFFLSAGYRVVGEPHWSVSTILERMRTSKVDAALIDATTLGQSLKWFIGELKTYNSDVVIIIMTSSPSKEQYELVASEPGVYDVIVKPFGFSEILMMVQRGLEEKRGLKPGKERRSRFRSENGPPVGIEKRRDYRVSCALPLTYSNSSVVEKESKTVDISPYGVRFAIDKPVNFPFEKGVHLKISLPGYGLFKPQGDIRWTRKIEGDIREQVGVQFTMIKDEEKHRIASYIYA